MYGMVTNHYYLILSANRAPFSLLRKMENINSILYQRCDVAYISSAKFFSYGSC